LSLVAVARHRFFADGVKDALFPPHSGPNPPAPPRHPARPVKSTTYGAPVPSKGVLIIGLRQGRSRFRVNHSSASRSLGEQPSHPCSVTALLSTAVTRSCTVCHRLETVCCHSVTVTHTPPRTSHRRTRPHRTLHITPDVLARHASTSLPGRDRASGSS